MNYFSFNNDPSNNTASGSARSSSANPTGATTATGTSTTDAAANNNASQPGSAPSTATGNGNGNVESFSEYASNVFSKENFQQVGNAAIEQIDELKQQTQDGDFSIKMLGFIGGVLLLVIASLEIVHKAVQLNVAGVFVELYTVILGAIVFILEGKQMILTSSVITKLHKYALFLKYLWGRGTLYFIAGTLQLTQFDLLNYIAGVYMCMLGVLYIFIGQRTASKLRSLKSSMISEYTLRTNFQEAASTTKINDGRLDRIQFRTLTQSLGMDMTRRETEAAFYYIPKEDSEKLTYEEFVTWWKDADVQDDATFVFV